MGDEGTFHSALGRGAGCDTPGHNLHPTGSQYWTPGHCARWENASVPRLGQWRGEGARQKGAGGRWGHSRGCTHMAPSSVFLF